MRTSTVSVTIVCRNNNDAKQTIQNCKLIFKKKKLNYFMILRCSFVIVTKIFGFLPVSYSKVMIGTVKYSRSNDLNRSFKKLIFLI